MLDYEPQWWFLLEDGDRFLVDANCNHSFVGYDFMIELNAQELVSYQAEGRTFIERLVREIQDTAPILIVSTSPFKGRDISKIYREQVTSAVKEWRASGRGN